MQAQRAAIDAQVARWRSSTTRRRSRPAAAQASSSGPSPGADSAASSQGFGCSTFYLEIYDPACPYPHRIHTGIDIAGPYGTQIVAADTGVVYLYPGSIGYGNMILMIHGNGYSTVYGHLAGYAPGLRSGMIVARGTTIAFEGSTGWSTGPHLHFEVRVYNAVQGPVHLAWLLTTRSRLIC